MKVRTSTLLLLAASVLLTGVAEIVDRASGQGSQVPPFFDARKNVSTYNGPGRDDPEPAGLTEVRIGYFGPADPGHPQGGDIWLAVNMAIEEANAQGGYKGLPFRLVQAWAENPWSNGAGLVVRMAYVDKVWAIIGGIDGASTHLAETVVTKARLTLISPGSTDKTVNLANVPWMFSALPGDHLLAPALGRSLLAEVGKEGFVLVASGSHDAHLFASELEKYLSANGRAPDFSYVFADVKDATGECAGRILETKPAAVVIVGDARDSAEIVNSLRQMGFSGKVFGGPSMGRRGFLEGIGNRGSGVSFACPAAGKADDFARIFEKRYGSSPDYTARFGYESVRLLVAAIRRAGLNRARICDAVRDLSPWLGAAAAIGWDGLGRNNLLQAGAAVCSLPMADSSASSRNH